MKMSQSPRLAGVSPASNSARHGWRLPTVTAPSDGTAPADETDEADIAYEG